MKKKALNFIPTKINRSIYYFMLSLLVVGFMSSCTNEATEDLAPEAIAITETTQNGVAVSRNGSESNFVGAVYAMSNGDGQVQGTNIQGANTIVAYGRNTDGTLELMNEYETGGNGGDFDGGEGIDPLISAYALVKSDDNRYLFAANAGSNTITVFRINSDYSLTRSDIASTGGVGPNSIAYSSKHRLVYVANIDADGVFNGEPDQEGSITGFRVVGTGQLKPIQHSTRQLGGRPSAIQFSPDGSRIVVAMINSGSISLASDSQDEVVAYRIERGGRPSYRPTGRATSTLRDNRQGRNLPSAIGFDIVNRNGSDYVFVTEAREFQADGTPPAFPALQTGSVSVFRLTQKGRLNRVQYDVLAEDGQGLNGSRTACWIATHKTENIFYVSNALEATISTYRFDNRGKIRLVTADATDGVGTGAGTRTNLQVGFDNTQAWIDLWISDDGKYLYQLFGKGSNGQDSSIGVFKINGEKLEYIQNVSDVLPLNNTQGIVAI